MEITKVIFLYDWDDNTEPHPNQGAVTVSAEIVCGKVSFKGNSGFQLFREEAVRLAYEDAERKMFVALQHKYTE